MYNIYKLTFLEEDKQMGGFKQTFLNKPDTSICFATALSQNFSKM